jgi:uncharacterized membrane protein
MLKNLRNSFFAGLVVLIPLGITILVFNILIQKIGAPASELFFGFLQSSWRNYSFINGILNGISTLIVVGLITVLGVLSNYFLGRWFIKTTEKILNRLPFINVVYKTAKQIVDTFAEQNKALFQKVVLVQFPKTGTYAIGFLTGVCKGEVQDKTQEKLCNVFVPTTPNPTSGFLVLVPDKELIYLSMNVGDAMKLIISGGAVTPGDLAKAEALPVEKTFGLDV